MWFPGQAFRQVSQDIVELFIAALNHEQVKAEIAKQTRVEIDNYTKKSMSSTAYGSQSYASLISGDVNMQMRMAASGYDVYGKTIITGNGPIKNDNAFKKMKNKIRYGRAPQNARLNRGAYSIH